MFTAMSVGERILKIDQHFAQFRRTYHGTLFSRQCSNDSILCSNVAKVYDVGCMLIIFCSFVQSMICR